MELLSLEIGQFKSLKNPVKISLKPDLPTVLIGKNGSGKTNILEALDAVFGNKKHLHHGAKIKLTREEFSRLLPGEKYTEENCVLSLENSERDLLPDRIKSDFIVPRLKAKVNDMADLADELKKALKAYKRQVNKIAVEDKYENDPLRCFNILDFKGRETNYDALESRAEFIGKQCDEFIKSIMTNFDKEDTFIFTTDFPPFTLSPSFDFKLEYREPDLPKFEKELVKIDCEKIKKQIEKINTATESACKQINDCLKKIEEKWQYFNNRESESEPLDNHSCFSLLKKIRKTVSAKCLLLRNESNNVIFYNNTPDDILRYRKSQVILQALCRQTGTDIEKSEFTQADLKAFEECLTKALPEFENGMYNGITVKSNNDGIEIFLREKTGEEISLNDTSAGRRWYFTYYFMKSTLEKGDVFIIDEPAAMLHPLAQKAVLAELEELAKQGVRVIYSTHSPYLIPESWETTHFVTMGENGTEVYTPPTQKDYYEGLKQISGNDIFNLQKIYDNFRNCNNSKIISKNCREAAREFVKKYKAEHKQEEKTATQLNDDAYKELGFTESTVKKWGSGTNNVKFENLVSVALKTEKNIMDFFNEN